MKRKILVTLLAFCLIASLCVVGAAAAAAGEPCEGGESCNHEAAIGDVHYASLNDALQYNAKPGDTIVVLKDCKINYYAPKNNSILDLNGHNVEYSGAAQIVFSGKGRSFSIVDSSAEVGTQGGTFRATGERDMAEAVFQISGGATFNVNNINIESNGCPIYPLQNNTSVNIKDSKIESSGVYCLSTNAATADKYGVIINISGSTLTTNANNYDNCAVMFNVGGSLNIENSSITGDRQAVLVRAGDATIVNSNITVTGKWLEYNTDLPATGDWLSGNEVPSAALIVGNYYSNTANAYLADANVTVEDTVVTARGNAPAVYVDGNTTYDATLEMTGEGTSVTGPVKIGKQTSAEATDITVTGGTFTDTNIDELKEYFPKNLALTVDSTGKVVPSDDAVAEVNNVPYKTLQAAIDAAEDNDTVTLIDNVTADGAGKGNTQGVITIDKDITLDGNGNTLSVKDATLDEDGRGPSVINIVSDADVKISDLTINAEDAKHGLNIFGAGEVTLEDVEISGSAWYAVVCNSSELTVNGLYTHDNAWGINIDTGDGDNSTVIINDANVTESDSIVFDNKNSASGKTTTTTIKGGSFKNIKNNEGVTGFTVNVEGGSFTESVADIATTPDYELNSNGSYTYYNTLSAAQAAAKPGDTITFVGGDSTVETHTVTVIYDGSTTYTYELADGTSFPLPVLEKSGYTFTGWRVNSSNTIVRGGESYPITANTTFTAVWNMIMIPDTYDIAVDQPAHGTVDVSLSNASQGSVITVTATPDEGYELVYITVDGEPISGNSFVMPDHAVEVSALFAEIGKEVNFVDVSRADWFYDYVQYVAQNGLMEGTTRTAFEPNASMTRAMFWTVLARIDGETITGDAWKTLAQTWAVESGISDGTNADALITREQMVTMLYRYAGSPVTGGMAISEFTDGASVSDYATDAVTWALSEGILTGMGDGILAPQGTATRAQAAAMLMRFVEA